MTYQFIPYNDAVAEDIYRPKYRPITTRESTSINQYIFVIVDNIYIQKALINLEKVYQLHDNWDSYGSPPLDTVLYENAKSFLYRLIQDVDIPEPSVGPVSGGGVQLEWQYESRELEIEFSEPDSVEYLQVFADREMKEGSIECRNFIFMKELINWLITG